VGELLEAWLDQVSGEPSPETVHEYRRPASGDRGNTGNHSVGLMREADTLLVEARTLQMPLARSTGNADDPAWVAAQELDRERLARGDRVGAGGQPSAQVRPAPRCRA